jgi:hypothetical protein
VPPQQNPLSIFHIKLSRVLKSLKSWSKNLVSQTKIVMVVYREVIAQMDLAQENRAMSLEERNLIKHLKMRLLGMATVEKTKAEQRSRITRLRHGDANTFFFT